MLSRRAYFWSALLLLTTGAHASSVGLSTPGVNSYPNGDTFVARSDSSIFSGESGVYVIAYNPSTNMALLGCNSTTPATVVQVDMGSITTPPTRIGAVQLNAGEGPLTVGVFDSVNNVALFGTDNMSTPATVVKVAFGTGGAGPTRVGAVTLNAGETRLYSAVIDPSSGQALFGTFTSPGVVVKINVNAAGAAPTRVNATSLLTGEDSLVSAVFDSGSGTALFGTYTSPGKVVKVTMNGVGVAPSRSNALMLNAGENILTCATQNLNTGEVLFGTDTNPGQVIKVGYGLPSSPPSRIGAVTLNSGENGLYCASADETHGVAMFGTKAGSASAVKINFNAAGVTPTREGAAQLPNGQNGFVASYFDSFNSRFVIAPSISSGTQLHSIVYSPQGFIAGTAVDLPEAATVNEVRFFSHVGSSAVRLGIYDVNKKLLWETSSHVLTSASTELVAPISNGTPSSLILPAGKYFLAFQVSTPDAVPSFTAGTQGDGFVFFQDFNPFTATLPAGAVTATASRYTEYITYDPYTSGPVISSFTADANPGFIGSDVHFSVTASSSDPNAVLSYMIDFGDGSAPQSGGMLQAGVPSSIGYAYSASGTYTVTVTVSNGIVPVSATLSESIPAPASGADGVKNVSDNTDAVKNPVDGLTINVLGSDGGVIQLQIDDTQLRANNEISTTFGDIPGRATTVTGHQPVHQFVQHGIFVADVKATDSATNTVVGHGRKTLALGRKETGETAQTSGDAPSAAIIQKSLKAKFIFSAQKDDACTFSGTITLPPGLDTSKPQEVSLALGNIVESTTLDTKGNGAAAGELKKLKVKFLKVKKGAITKGGETATITVQFVGTGMVDAGFDTEGVSSKAADATGGKKAGRSIQIALVLAGVPYETLAPVTFAISKKGDTGQLQGRAVK